MLQKSKSKQLNLLKYALLIPLVFGMLIYTSTEVRAQQKTNQETTLDQELADEELIKKYYDEFFEMEKNGATFFEIAAAAGLKNDLDEKYLQSREEFLKKKAYMEYIADGLVKTKSEKGTLTPDDIDSSERMKLNKFKTYDDFKTWKMSDEAKDLWMASRRGGVLRLFVNDVRNYTTQEKLHFDGLMMELEKDDDLKKMIVTDGVITTIIKSPNTSEVQETVEVPFSVVEETPTTKACQDLETNIDRKHCFNDFVIEHVGENFNTKVTDSLNPGRKRIFVQFKINTEGYVTDIKARGPHPELEVEAKRVIGSLPQFRPGKQKGKLVTVPYSLPIVFQVTEPKKD